MSIDEIKTRRSAVKAGRVFAQVGGKRYRVLRVNQVRVVLQAEHGPGWFSIEPNGIESMFLDGAAVAKAETP